MNIALLHEIGGRIRELRKTHHYSQQDLSRELGLSQGMLSSIENKKSTISLHTLTKACAVFKVTSEWLIHGVDLAGKQKQEHDFIPLVNSTDTVEYIRNLQSSGLPEDLGYFKIPGFAKGEFRLFEVAGDEMYPSLERTDLAICERISDHENIEGGSLCAIVSANRLWLQRVYPGDDEASYIMENDNPRYGKHSLRKRDILEAWRVKSKITSSFVQASLERIQRVEHLEKEVEMIKEQFARISSKL